MAKSSKGFAVLGLSGFGYRTAVGLFAAGADVIAVDKDPVVVQKISRHVTRAVQADALDLEVLDHLGIFQLDCVVIGFRSSFETSILLAHHLKTNTSVGRVLAQADTEAKGEALRRMGVDEVVIPESDIADRVVRRLTLPDLVDHFPLSANAAILEVTTPPAFVGRSLIDLDIRARYGVYVIGIRHREAGADDDGMEIAPAPGTEFGEGDTMLLLGNSKALAKFSDEVLAH